MPFEESCQKTLLTIDLTLLPHKKVTDNEANIILKTLDLFLKDELPNLGMDFAPWKFKDNELYGILLGLYLKFGLVKDCSTLTDLLNYMYEVALLYKETAYHCFRHACDITYLVFFILYDLGAAEWFGFSKLEVAALLTASLGHDSLHPGTNNLYQVNAKTEAACGFGSSSPLEKQSIYMVLHLLFANRLVEKLDLEHDFSADGPATTLPNEFLSKLPSFKEGIDPHDTSRILGALLKVPLDGVPNKLSSSELDARLLALNDRENLFYRIIYESILNTDMFFHFMLLEELARLVDTITIQPTDDAEDDAGDELCSSEISENSDSDISSKSSLELPVQSTPSAPSAPIRIGDSETRAGPVPPPLTQLAPFSAPRVSAASSCVSFSNTTNMPSSASNGRRRPLSVSSPISPLARSGLEQVERAMSIHKLEGGLSSLQLRAIEDPSVPSEFPTINSASSLTLATGQPNCVATTPNALLADPAVGSLAVRQLIQCPALSSKLSTLSLKLPTAQRRLLLSAILHMADISNAARPPEIMLLWSQLVTEEFVLQSDLEKKYGLPGSPNMDRETYSQARSSFDFNQLVVRPTFELLADILPPVGVFVQWCDHNRTLWQNELESDASPFGRGSLRDQSSVLSEILERKRALSLGGSALSSLSADNPETQSADDADNSRDSVSLQSEQRRTGDATEGFRSNADAAESELASSTLSLSGSSKAGKGRSSKSPAARLKTSLYDNLVIGRERRLSVAAGTVEIPAFMIPSASSQVAAAHTPLASSANSLTMPQAHASQFFTTYSLPHYARHGSSAVKEKARLESVLVISPALKNAAGSSSSTEIPAKADEAAKSLGASIDNAPSTSGSSMLERTSLGSDAGGSSTNLSAEKSTGEFPFLFHYQKYHQHHQHTSPNNGKFINSAGRPIGYPEKQAGEELVSDSALVTNGNKHTSGNSLSMKPLSTAMEAVIKSNDTVNSEKGKSPVVGRWGKLFIAAQTMNQHPKSVGASSPHSSTGTLKITKRKSSKSSTTTASPAKPASKTASAGRSLK